MGDLHGQGATILVVEDVEETRDAIEGLLRVDGYCLIAARHEEDAIERARRKRPDLILMSLDGLGTDVIATALRIRTRAELGEDVPVVIFCVHTIAHGAEVEIEKNVHVTRPDNFDQLRGFLRRLLQNIPPGR
jgi:CheY-like chemotaxis protein